MYVQHNRQDCFEEVAEELGRIRIEAAPRCPAAVALHTVDCTQLQSLSPP